MGVLLSIFTTAIGSVIILRKLREEKPEKAKVEAKAKNKDKTRKEK